jgi:hypothetical protein
MAPTPLRWSVSVRARRFDEDEEARASRLDSLNEQIMHGVNATGKAFLSHTKLNDKLTLRLRLETSARPRNMWPGFGNS